jgi:hypothetical protein
MRKQIGFKITGKMLGHLLFKKEDMDILDIVHNKYNDIYTFILQHDDFKTLCEGEEIMEVHPSAVGLKGYNEK